MQNDISTTIALVVYNTTRSCVMMRRLTNNIWTLPTARVSTSKDPSYFINGVITQIDGEFDLVSAVCIAESSMITNNVSHNCFVYEIRYSGKVKPDLIHANIYSAKYVESKWVPFDKVNKLDINHVTSVYIAAVQQNKNLK